MNKLIYRHVLYCASMWLLIAIYHLLCFVNSLSDFYEQVFSENKWISILCKNSTWILYAADISLKLRAIFWQICLTFIMTMTTLYCIDIRLWRLNTEFRISGLGLKVTARLHCLGMHSCIWIWISKSQLTLHLIPTHSGAPWNVTSHGPIHAHCLNFVSEYICYCGEASVILWSLRNTSYVCCIKILLGNR